MKLHTFPLLAVSLLLSACGLIYKTDVTQGNIYSETQTAQIQAGMSREQVHQILGTPVIQDPFHADSETYQFTFKSGATGRLYRRSFTVNYANGAVTSTKENPIAITQ